MMLGPFAFEVLGFGYEDVQRRTSTPWVDIQVAQSLNQQQWTGPTSEEVTIKGVLFTHEFGGQAQLDGIISAANAGEPLMFVSGDTAEGRIHGIFTIQSVDEDRSFHDAAGEARRNSYSLKLKRYSSSGAASFKTIASTFG